MSDTPGTMRTRTSGCSARRAARARTSRSCCTDAIAPTRNRPLIRPAPAMPTTRSAMATSTSACGSRLRPWWFKAADLPVRSNSATPRCSSRRLICALTADCVRPSRRPAPVKVPPRATAMKVLNSRITIDFIDAQPEYLSFFYHKNN
ncbi:Uncharacterised protein [Bordetella pertussis]|nr:Uncharacterised protein [Bordetella pertussis]CFW38407.1 Uncharacterised protein [Bordetella pertussis]